MGSQQGLVHQLIIHSAGSRPQPWPSPDEYTNRTEAMVIDRGLDWEGLAVGISQMCLMQAAEIGA